MDDQHQEEHWKRWRLILGGDADPSNTIGLGSKEKAMDQVLEALYQSNKKKGLGSSSPELSKWLGDIRSYFPTPVVRMIQKDALTRLGLKEMLLEPEILEQIEPDIHLVSTILSLKEALPEKTRQTARIVVGQLVEKLRKKLKGAMEQNLKGRINKAAYHFRPSRDDLDWQRTIRINLKNYQPELKRIIPERLVGNKRKRRSLKHLILLVDQSGSMAESMVFAGIIGSILASLPTFKTDFILFDTSIADMTDQLDDPVSILFSSQLGGGTDIALALKYADGRVRNPADTLLFCITDLEEGGSEGEMLRQFLRLKEKGIKTHCILGIDDGGKVRYDHDAAKKVRSLDIPCFTATPNELIELIAKEINQN